MELKVKLQTMLYSLEGYDDMEEDGYYIDISTGREYVLWDELVDGEVNDTLYEEIVNTPQKYIQLPDNRKIDTFDMMEEFVVSRVYDEKTQKKLRKTIKQIKRNGRIFSFGKEVNVLGLLQNWNDFKDVYYERFARQWCAKHNILLVD